MSRVRQNPLLAFLIHMTQAVLLRKIAYLKAENAILRSRCPKNVQTTPAERALLVRLGAPLGDAIQELLSLVHYKTFLRWKREGMQPIERKRPPGRPPTPPNVQELILRFAKENGWGYLFAPGIEIRDHTGKTEQVRLQDHTENQLAILRELRRESSLSRSDLASLLHLTVRAIDAEIAPLIAQGDVVQEGSGAAMRYKIVSNDATNESL